MKPATRSIREAMVPSEETATDRIGRRLASAIVIAAAIVGLSIWARPSPPRYDIAVRGEEVLRINRNSGRIVSCRPGQRCVQIVGEGGHSFSLKSGNDRPATKTENRIGPPSS